MDACGTYSHHFTTISRADGEPFACRAARSAQVAHETETLMEMLSISFAEKCTSNSGHLRTMKDAACSAQNCQDLPGLPSALDMVPNASRVIEDITRCDIHHICIGKEVIWWLELRP